MIQSRVALILHRALSTWPVSVSPGFTKNGGVGCGEGCVAGRPFMMKSYKLAPARDESI